MIHCPDMMVCDGGSNATDNQLFNSGNTCCNTSNMEEIASIIKGDVLASSPPLMEALHKELTHVAPFCEVERQIVSSESPGRDGVVGDDRPCEPPSGMNCLVKGAVPSREAEKLMGSLRLTWRADVMGNDRACEPSSGVDCIERYVLHSCEAEQLMASQKSTRETNVVGDDRHCEPSSGVGCLESGAALPCEVEQLMTFSMPTQGTDAVGDDKPCEPSSGVDCLESCVSPSCGAEQLMVSSQPTRETDMVGDDRPCEPSFGVACPESGAALHCETEQLIISSIPTEGTDVAADDIPCEPSSVVDRLESCVFPSCGAEQLMVSSQSTWETDVVGDDRPCEPSFGVACPKSGAALHCEMEQLIISSIPTQGTDVAGDDIPCEPSSGVDCPESGAPLPCELEQLMGSSMPTQGTDVAGDDRPREPPSGMSYLESGAALPCEVEQLMVSSMPTQGTDVVGDDRAHEPSLGVDRLFSGDASNHEPEQLMASSQSTGRTCVVGDDRPSEPPSQIACVESGGVAGASAFSISATDKFGQGRSEGKDDTKLNFTLVYKRGSLRRSSRSVSSSHAVAKLELLPSTTNTLWQFRQMGGFLSKEVRKKRSFTHRRLRDSAWGALEHLTGISSPDPRVVKVQKKGSKKAKCRLGEKGRQKARKDGSSRGSRAKCMFLSSRPRVQVDTVNFAAGTPKSLSDGLHKPDSLVDLGVGVVVVDGCEHNIVTQMADVTSINNENPAMSFDASFRNGSHGNKEMESTVTEDVSVENTSGECPMVPGLVGPIYDRNFDQGISPDLDVLHLIPQSGSITSESVDTSTLRETFSDDGLKNQNDLNPESKVEADLLNIASGSFGVSDELLPAKHAKQKKVKKKGKIRGTPCVPSEHKCVEKAVLNSPDSKKTRRVNRSQPSRKVQNSFHSRRDSHSEISGNIGETTTRIGELLDEPGMHRETFQKNEREAHALNLEKGGGLSFSGVMGNNSALSSPEGTSTCSQASSEGMLSSVMVPGSEDDLAPKKSLAWASCDDCGKWRRIPNVLVDVIGQTDSKWTCKDNTDKDYADCSVPQEMSDEDINLELGIPNTSCEDNSCIVQLNSKVITTLSSSTGGAQADAFGFDEATEGRAFLPFVVKGYGLQLQEDVSKGDFLIEYVGEVLDLPEYEARQRHYASRGQKHFYFMTLNGSEVIDACAKGNLGRFINHSCDPNCRTEKWMVNGEVCVGLFAIRDLKKGEEVTFDYNYVRVFGAVAKKCVCGSAGCRGYIGGDPLKTEAVDQDHSDDDYPEPVMVNEYVVNSSGDTVTGSVGDKSLIVSDAHRASKSRPRVKSSVSHGTLRKGKRSTISLVGDKSNAVAAVSGNRCSDGVEQKLNEFLDLDGGISKRKEDASKGYLKLLLLTAACGDNVKGEAIQSTRDLSIILDALLKTKSRMILVDVINKNGLQMLHNIMKQNRKNFNRTPVIRKLLKVFEFLASSGILTLEHIARSPPYSEMESLEESIISLRRHNDLQVQQMARSFLEKWVPLESKRISPCNRGGRWLGSRNTNDRQFLSSYKHHRHPNPRDYVSNHRANQMIHSAPPSRGMGASENSIPTRQGSILIPVNSNSRSEVKPRKRKTRWDQPGEAMPDSTETISKFMKPSPVEEEPDSHRPEDSNQMRETSSEQNQLNNGQIISVSSEDIDDEAPPGFSTPLVHLRQVAPEPVEEECLGLPQERYNPHKMVSYGMPMALVEQVGIPCKEEDGKRKGGFQAHRTRWDIAPAMPFYPFPPLPPLPRENHDAPVSPGSLANDGLRSEQVSNNNHKQNPRSCSSDNSFSETGVHNHCNPKRHMGWSSSDGLDRRFFRQQKWTNRHDNGKVRRPWVRHRNGFHKNSPNADAEGIYNQS
ncbi:Histone-lysine N-methyltransferase ASHH2 [Acorus gramineus]|uniref:Histone-lysine N-methyltransferase ASHH2 n=1 Tax=Acorus gramineus TaxID=55184 RepID=A0AAV9BUZ6_ACOGR|nr:Histone-lysine N-methyltransferase ASHH2 [Acorus gramineus]